MLVGPRGTGKKSILHAICTETGANLFDLTATNIAGKYPGKSGLTMLLHLVFKVTEIASVNYLDIPYSSNTQSALLCFRIGCSPVAAICHSYRRCRENLLKESHEAWYLGTEALTNCFTKTTQKIESRRSSYCYWNLQATIRCYDETAKSCLSEDINDSSSRLCISIL